jgi:hypothetical protein
VAVKAKQHCIAAIPIRQAKAFNNLSYLPNFLLDLPNILCNNLVRAKTKMKK